MNKWVKEILWLCLPAIVAIVMLTDLNDASFTENFVLNVGDTYYVISPTTLFALFFIPLFLFTCVSRLLYHGVRKGKIPKFILIGFQVFIILLLVSLIFLNELMKEPITIADHPPGEGFRRSIDGEERYILFGPVTLPLVLLLVITLSVYSFRKLKKTY